MPERRTVTCFYSIHNRPGGVVLAKGKCDLHLDFLLGVANKNGKICNSGTVILNVNTSSI